MQKKQLDNLIQAVHDGLNAARARKSTVRHSESPHVMITQLNDDLLALREEFISSQERILRVLEALVSQPGQ